MSTAATTMIIVTNGESVEGMLCCAASDSGMSASDVMGDIAFVVLVSAVVELVDESVVDNCVVLVGIVICDAAVEGIGVGGVGVGASVGGCGS